MEKNNLLKTLKLPDDLPKLNLEQLNELSVCIRERLIDVVSETGGHLASNLGVVELTIAMYSIWNPFTNKIIWDVGHQTYVHKILTGRNDELSTIRQLNGLSGFPKREESMSDAFNTGHSSTSISAALGMVRANRITNDKKKVIAVIGDGALTGGMAFEALNDAARIYNDITIILNDNGMSISRNVGGMSRYLGRIRTGKSYIRLKKGFKAFLLRVPFLGEKLVSLIQRLKLSIKILVIPGDIFEELGFKYIGPVDGHNISEIKKVLKKVEYMYGPVIVHVVTKKGYGYKPAEKNPDMFHGVSPFDKETGNMRKNINISFSRNFSKHLCELAEKDKTIAAITAAMQNGTGLREFSNLYPDRFFDVGIAEQHAITMASGMATGNVKPFVAMYSTFLQRAYDQVLHDAALQKLPMVISVDRAGISGTDGETHQGIYDLAYLNHIPNLTVTAPCCIEEQSQFMDIALDLMNKKLCGPFVIRYPAYDNYTHDREYIIKNPVAAGKGLVMNDENKSYDIALIAIGRMVETAMSVSEKLKLMGYTAIVFNARFLSPLDTDGIFDVVSRSKCYMTLEDGVKKGGFGSSVICALTEKGLMRHAEIVGLPDEPIPHGSIDSLHVKYGMDAQSVTEKAVNLINKAEMIQNGKT